MTPVLGSTREQFIFAGTNKLVNEFASVVHYYEGRLCSCVGANEGSFDPDDDCILGFRYKSPVEYNLMRTSVDYRRITQEVGKVLQGGAVLTMPRVQLNHHAFIITKDLSGNVDVSTNKLLKIAVDAESAVEFDVSDGAVSASAVTIDELIKVINAAGLGEIAYESDENGDPNGINYITIRSLKVKTDSKVDILVPSATDATGIIFGLGTTQYPKTIKPDIATTAYLPIYHKISQGDVLTVESRFRRDGDLLRKGVRDTIHHFDVQRIISIMVGSTIYKEEIDFTHSDGVITWTGVNDPAANTDYAVEYLCKQNYIVFDELASDRGSDTDRIAKKIHLALRNYANTLALPIAEGS